VSVPREHGAASARAQDIEGAEFETLGNMLMQRTLCADTIHTMTIEYHAWQWNHIRRANQRWYDLT
jgi:hypothetical protein